MTESGTTPPPIRRRDRAVADEAWIRTMLQTAPTGVLATVADGQPFVNANLFVYDGDRSAIYLHTARRGHTRDTVEADGRVAFTVMEMGRLLPAEEALEFSVEYASVIIYGRGSILQDPVEAKRALQLLLDKYFDDLTPDRDYRSTTDAELARTTVYRIDISEMVGKRKQVEPGFPGARRYAAPSMVELAPAPAEPPSAGD